MDWPTIIAVIVIAAILFFAIRYIYRKNKKGIVCIGCPFAESCPRHKPESDTCRNKKGDSANSGGDCCCH